MYPQVILKQYVPVRMDISTYKARVPCLLWFFDHKSFSFGGDWIVCQKKPSGSKSFNTFHKSSGFYSPKQPVCFFFGISMRGILDSGIKKLETLSEFIQNYKTKGLFKLLALWVPGFFHREVEHLFSQVLGFDGETLETPGLATPTGWWHEHVITHHVSKVDTDSLISKWLFLFHEKRPGTHSLLFELQYMPA